MSTVEQMTAKQRNAHLDQIKREADQARYERNLKADADQLAWSQPYDPRYDRHLFPHLEP